MDRAVLKTGAEFGAKEKQFADFWMRSLKKEFPKYVLARNKPNKGAGPGINDSLRQKVSQDHYIGIELELGQALLMKLDSKSI